MECCNCKAKNVCAAVVQPGSVICMMNHMRHCGTHAEEEAHRQAGDYCQYCGHRLREIGRERFCNNVNCRNRYVNVCGAITMDEKAIYSCVDREHDAWRCGQCGYIENFEADGPVENGWNLCPGCGKEITLAAERWRAE